MEVSSEVTSFCADVYLWYKSASTIKPKGEEKVKETMKGKSITARLSDERPRRSDTETLQGSGEQ